MQKKAFFKFLGFAFSVLPPLIATVDQFPLMTRAGKYSILAIIAIALCCVPFIKQIKQFFRSPSAWMMWLVIFILCVILRALVDEFYTISMLGLIGSLIGAVCFKIAGKEVNANG